MQPSSSTQSPSGFRSFVQGFRSLFETAPTGALDEPKQLIQKVSGRIFKNEIPTGIQKVLPEQEMGDKLIVGDKEIDLVNADVVQYKIFKLTGSNEALTGRILDFISQDHAFPLLSDIQKFAQVNHKQLELTARLPVEYRLQRFPGTDAEHPIITLVVTMKGHVPTGIIHDSATGEDYPLNNPAYVVGREQINFSNNTSEIYHKAEFSAQVLSIYREEQKYNRLIDGAIEELERDDRWNSEGIFRLSGSSEEIGNFMLSCSNVPLLTLRENLGEIGSADTLAAILKNLIKKRKLVPEQLFDTFNGVAAQLEHLSPEEAEKVKIYLKQIINSMPSSNRELLKRIVDFSLKISEASDVNKMTINNLAIVLAPNIFQLPEGTDPLIALASIGKLNQLFAFILTNRDFLFGDSTVAGTSGI